MLVALALVVAACFEDRMLGVLGDGGQPISAGACAARVTHDACQALSGCRWLEPGCGSPALPRATCAPVAELNCGMDADCPTGKRCQTYSTNPCGGPAAPGQLTCGACGQQTMVCW